jgi:heme exporter protein C
MHTHDQGHLVNDSTWPMNAQSAALAKGHGLWRHAAPAAAYKLAARVQTWATFVAAWFAVAGLYVGLLVAPTDHQQGEAYRIIFVHVPAAWLSMLLYVAMAFWAAVGWVFNTRVSFLMARALAPSGALFTFLALWTGAFWGRPTWGTWWVWDARLTSELILLFLYLGVMGLQAAIADPRRGDRAGALLTLVGVVNVPIIYFSVQWWNTLHQGASISFKSAPTMATPMLTGMLLCTVALWAWAVAVVLKRLRVLILERETDALWVRAHVLGSTEASSA